MMQLSRSKADHTTMRLLREIYFSMFVLFYRVSQWKGRMKVRTASICVAIVEAVWAVTIWVLVQTASGRYIELNPWVLVVCMLVITWPSDYFLVSRGYGLAFVKEFDAFGKRKQISLYLAAICIILATGIVFYFATIHCHQYFNIPQVRQ